jgi:hypothetical protein
LKYFRIRNSYWVTWEMCIIPTLMFNKCYYLPYVLSSIFKLCFMCFKQNIPLIVEDILLLLLP